MVNPDLIKLLVCPSCLGELQFDPQEQTFTCMNRHCSACAMPVDENGRCSNPECGVENTAFVGLRYRTVDDIPIMLIEEAEKLPLS